jgi:pimeloyl-ACP methyl ester carboxylesterase
VPFDPMIPVPVPAQVHAHEGLATLTDTKLWYWDTGGPGPPIILLHAASGSALSWGYQQPVFAAAGYRVIAYSRRGYYNSDSASKEALGTNSEDLRELADFLGLESFHAVATAAAVQLTLDFALSYQPRLKTMVLACGVGNATDRDFVEMKAGVKPNDYTSYPVSFRELGPSYRAANHEGTRQWEELSRSAITGIFSIEQLNEITWARLETLDVPTLLIAGDADLSAPPPMVRKYAEHIPKSEFEAVAEAGHSVYWERPDVFNQLVLRFLGKHSAP